MGIVHKRQRTHFLSLPVPELLYQMLMSLSTVVEQQVLHAFTMRVSGHMQR